MLDFIGAPIHLAGGDVGMGDEVGFPEAMLAHQTVLVISGDAITDLDLTALVAHHTASGSDLTVGLARVNEPIEYGGVVLDDAGLVTRLVEKPGWGSVVSDLVNTGVYVVEPHVLTSLPARTRLDWAADVIPALLAEGRAVSGYVSNAYWEDVGTVAAYFRSQLAMSVEALGFLVRLRTMGLLTDEAQEEIQQVVEGVLAAEAVKEVADELGIEMPICQQIYQILYEGKTPREAVQALMTRELKPENL